VEAELSEVKPVLEKLKTAFTPEQTPEPVVETEEQKFEKWYAQKEAVRTAEVAQKQLQETIKTQINTLTTEWN
jgi:hypothetical protein